MFCYFCLYESGKDEQNPQGHICQSAGFHDNIIIFFCSYVTKQEEISDSDEFNEFIFGAVVCSLLYSGTHTTFTFFTLLLDVAAVVMNSVFVRC